MSEKQGMEYIICSLFTVSEAPEGTPTKKFPSYNAKVYKTDTEKKEEVYCY